MFYLEKPEGKRQYSRSVHRKDNIKTDLKETAYNSTRLGIRLNALMKTVMGLWVP
jgi:hypothetical protein